MVPVQECLAGAVQHLYDLLCKNPDYQKDGLGLFLADVSRYLRCLGWEHSLVPRIREIMSWYEQGELTDEDAPYLSRAIASQYGSIWAEAA